MVVIHGGSCADLEIVFAREKGAVVRRWIWRRCGGVRGAQVELREAEEEEVLSEAKTAEAAGGGGGGGFGA